MPEMDGYQATAKLRSDARFSALPIIAMTAHATFEERQRCLAAGMNDHISKPIDPAMLFETVGRYYKPANAAPPAERSAGVSPLQPSHDERQTSSSSLPQVTASKRPPEDRAPQLDDLPVIPGLDTADGLSRVAGNRKLYLKLLRQFIEQQGPVLGQITDALTKGDMPLAERLAHTLKGVAGNIGAKAVQFVAGALEKLIRDQAEAGTMESAQHQLATILDPLLAQLRGALGSAGVATPVPSPTTAAVDPVRAREMTAQLARLLSEFDPGAADFIETNQAALRPLFTDETWPQFEKLVQSYAFAEAQAQLEHALKTSLAI
jgi:two-component system, sensor histidine kinase and response regulator